MLGPANTELLLNQPIIFDLIILLLAHTIIMGARRIKITVHLLLDIADARQAIVQACYYYR